MPFCYRGNEANSLSTFLAYSSLRSNGGPTSLVFLLTPLAKLAAAWSYASSHWTSGGMVPEEGFEPSVACF